MDYKSILINLSRDLKTQEPVFTATSVGPSHIPSWDVRLYWRGKSFTASAPRKIAAEQRCAELALADHHRTSYSRILIGDYASDFNGTTMFIVTTDVHHHAILDCSHLQDHIGKIAAVRVADDAQKIMTLVAVASAVCSLIAQGSIKESTIVINSKYSNQIAATLESIYRHVKIERMTARD